MQKYFFKSTVTLYLNTQRISRFLLPYSCDIKYKQACLIILYGNSLKKMWRCFIASINAVNTSRFIRTTGFLNITFCDLCRRRSAFFVGDLEGYWWCSGLSIFYFAVHICHVWLVKPYEWHWIEVRVRK